MRILMRLPLQFKSFRLTTEQMLSVGVQSLPLVVFTAVFTGMVSAVQAAYQMADRVPMIYLGSGVCKAVVIELGPVITALVVGARVGAGMAAELGTMRVTEQIDALETLAVDPLRYLALPRFVAGVVMLPALVVFANFVALLGGWVVAVLVIRIPTHTYTEGLKLFFYARDVIGGIVKAVFFGAIIATMGCFQGFRAEGGAEGVGRATTRAVVGSSVLVLIFDYVVASWIFH
jgi:phospholipid/cholesterol/gamma-HCH transport system permease protein